MVRTKAVMIVNQLNLCRNNHHNNIHSNNHHYINDCHKQQPPSRRPLRKFQYEDLFDEEELNNPFYQEDDFEDEAYDGNMAYG